MSRKLGAHANLERASNATFANAQLALDGTPITAPYTFTGVEGIIRTLGVVPPQTSGGTAYDFGSARG